MLSLSPKRHANLDMYKKTAYLTKYSFVLGLDDVKTYNSYHANVKSDEVKQFLR